MNTDSSKLLEGRAPSRPFSLLAALLLAASSMLVVTARAEGTLAVGQKFPDLTAAGLVGEIPNLAEARIVIVDFWASWCAPCKASFPVYEELNREYGSKGVVIVAVSVDQNRKAMDAFLKKQAVSFPVVHDAEQKLVAQVAVPTMPTSFVVDAKGVIRSVHVGFHGKATKEQYIKELESLLAEAS